MIKIRDGELAASLTDSIPQLETDSVRMERDSYVLVLWIEDPVITAYGILKKESVKVENGKRIERETVYPTVSAFGRHRGHVLELGKFVLYFYLFSCYSCNLMTNDITAIFLCWFSIAIFLLVIYKYMHK